MPKTVLIVEDDSDARAIYEEALTERGFTVLIALHGAEGVHLARRHKPDLILMDIRMPVMDGWQAIEYLKSDPATAHIPIWAISAYIADEETMEEQPSWFQFDRLVSKPVDPVALVSEIESRIGRPAPPPEPLT